MSSNRACRVESLDLEAIKSPSSTSWMSNSSSPSPSSTLSDSSNCTLKRKPRTPRKRPNQTYNEAAAILSTAYPKIFPVNNLTKAHNINNTFLFEPSELLMPCQQLESSLDSRMTWMEKADFSIHVKGLMNSESPEMDSSEFDTGSILDEELGEGIESIMGNMEIENQQIEITKPIEFCYGYPVGRGFQVEYGMRRESRAMRDVDRCDWWSFPTVNLIEVAPFESMKIKNSESVPQLNAGLLLKLNYDDVLHAWSDKDSPFAGDSPANESAGNDVRARAAQIDLFSDNGGVREASVLRYKEKRRTRLFSKKIRYQVRKLNADRRPRMKGRFVRTPED